MQPLAGFADELGESRFDVHVDVFQRRIPGEFAPLDLGADGTQTADDGIAVVGAQYAGGRKGVGMGDGALDVVVVQPPVDIHGRREAGDEFGGGLRESSTPHARSCVVPVGVARVAVVGHGRCVAVGLAETEPVRDYINRRFEHRRIPVKGSTCQHCASPPVAAPWH